MRCIEIITLRSTRVVCESVLTEFLRHQVREGELQAEGRPVDIKIYTQAGMDSDISIHIHWDKSGKCVNKSSIGFNIVQELKCFGLISHSIWIEKGSKSTELRKVEIRTVS